MLRSAWGKLLIFSTSELAFRHCLKIHWDFMINVLLFLPIHCRKTTVPNSIREGLRKKYTEKQNNTKKQTNKKQPKKNTITITTTTKTQSALRLKSSVPGIENQDLFILNFLDQR